MELQLSVSFGCLLLPVDEKPAFGDNVFNKMKNNPKYPNPPVPYTTLDTNNQQLQAAITAALSGDHELIAKRNEMEKTWNHDIKETAKYVDVIANGSEVDILGAGFKTTKKESTPATKPDKPANFDASISKGSASLGCDDSLKTTACAYMLRTQNVQLEVIGNVLKATVGGETFWVALDTHKHTIVPGLPSHVPLFASMIAFNHKGASQVTSEIEL